MDTLERQIRRRWHSVAADLNVDNPYERIGPMLDEATSDAHLEAAESLKPPLTLLELGIGFLLCLHLSLRPDRLSDFSKRPRLLAPIILTGAACQHAAAIRKLVLGGLDGSARVVVRTMLETLLVCILCLKDQTVDEAFRKVDTFKGSRAVWNKYFRLEHFVSGLYELDREAGLPTEVTEEVRNWLKESLRFYAQYVHPSYAGAFLTAMPPRVSTSHVGFLPFGIPSRTSLATITDAVRWIWYCGLQIMALIFRGPKLSGRLYRLDRENPTHIDLIFFWKVFEGVVLEKWSKGFLEKWSRSFDGDIAVTPPKPRPKDERKQPRRGRGPRQ